MTCRFDIKDDELCRLRYIGQRWEGSSPVMIRRNVSERKRGGVDEIDLVSNSVTDYDLRDVGHGSCNFDRKTDDVIFTNGNDFNRKG